MLSKYLFNNLVKYINHLPDLQKLEKIDKKMVDNTFDGACMISYKWHDLTMCSRCGYLFCDSCLSNFVNITNMLINIMYVPNVIQ